MARHSLKNKSVAIFRKYYIYNFGKGYKPLDKEKRLCFAEIKAPDNSLDKHILMIIRERKNGNTQFDINNETWHAYGHGNIISPNKPVLYPHKKTHRRNGGFSDMPKKVDDKD
ncbi:DUF943 family protein [Cronobacter turicensis]|uniref:DUF943 family protein n=1 Tax=Cronobacter turicensis TaxID=413502 RepID=UPI002F268AAD